MSIILRDYQQDLIDKARVALRRSKRVLIQAPTGAGKTALAATMMKSAAEKQIPSLFIVHRRELLEQTAATLDKVGTKYSFCAADEPFNPYAPVLLCLIDTLKNRLDKLFARRFIFWDEAHHAAAAGWSKVAKHFEGAYHVGLSATPERLDGKGLNGQFDELIPGPKVKWLIENGYLCRYKAYAPMTPNMDGVRQVGGDYDKAQLDAILDGKQVLSDIVKHYKRLTPGKRAVAFVHKVERSEQLAAEFIVNGVRAASLDGTTDKTIRRNIIKAYRDGDIDVLVNVDLFGEGFDLPAMEVVITARPTMSLSLAMQQMGRVLRPSDGKEFATILDCAGVLAQHGLPDFDREWSLEGRDKKKKKGSEEMMQCPICMHCHEPAPKCPDCGHVYKAAKGGGKPRELEEVDGDLKEVDLEAAHKKFSRDRGMAETLEELVRIGTARGMKKPEEWAAHVWTAREAKKQERAEQQAAAYRR